MEFKTIKIYDFEAQVTLKGLRLDECMNINDFEKSPENSEQNKNQNNLKEFAVSDVLTCSYCNVKFVDISAQRNHYKLDWHRYNLKRSLSGNKPVSEEIFPSLRDGCSSSFDANSDPSSEEITSIFYDFTISERKEKSQAVHYNHKTLRHNKIFFKNDDNQILSIYRCLLHSKKDTLDPEDLVKNACNLIKHPNKWVIIMLGGGHFAAAIFDNGNITHHKTFHSYTVRAKQGGMQFLRDNKGSGHSKSAGASLRHYNEQALTQHVQEIIKAWSMNLKECSLILYRATGPYNRGILFGSKNPLFNKTDPRLRSIPFPTRKANFKEIQRVYEVLSSIEVYGSYQDFLRQVPKPSANKVSSKLKVDQSILRAKTNTKKVDQLQNNRTNTLNRNKGNLGVVQSNRTSQEEILPFQCNAQEDGEIDLVWNECTVDFLHLREFEDSFSEDHKKFKLDQEILQKQKHKVNSKRKAKIKNNEWNEKYCSIQKSLIISCKSCDKDSLINILNIYDELPDETFSEKNQSKFLDSKFTKKDFIRCLNSALDEETQNTALHLAAAECRPDFIKLLLMAGADPTIKNRNKLTPYFLATDKQSRNSFREFAASFPEKFDVKKANIPEPLTEELGKKLTEKKKEKKKLKRLKEKKKIQELQNEKRENEEKKFFLALSDHEKCALVAERLMMTSNTANQKSAKIQVLSRCFQCGANITGKVPYEYGTNTFCSVSCLKAHRAKTNSYGKEL